MANSYLLREVIRALNSGAGNFSLQHWLQAKAPGGKGPIPGTGRKEGNASQQVTFLE